MDGGSHVCYSEGDPFSRRAMTAAWAWAWAASNALAFAPRVTLRAARGRSAAPLRGRRAWGAASGLEERPRQADLTLSAGGGRKRPLRKTLFDPKPLSLAPPLPPSPFPLPPPPAPWSRGFISVQQPARYRGSRASRPYLGIWASFPPCEPRFAGRRPSDRCRDTQTTLFLHPAARFRNPNGFAGNVSVFSP